MIQPNAILQDRYRVVRKLGQGGMGAVYEALDTRLKSTVALKQTLVAGEQLQRAFEREAQLLSGLHHPALPHVIDYFGDASGQYLVMQYIPGEDLGRMLQREQRPAPVGLVLRWADELLDVLDYLHSHEPPILHRDVKPDNLKLTKRGTIVLLDFGLAKGSTAAMTKATTSSVLGYTPHFAPLEQIRGQGTDARSDLYSAAATLYALLTAGPPLDALSRADAVVNGDPDPLSRADALRPEVPAAVAGVLHAALALKRADRPQSAAEMRSALLRAAAQAAPTTTAPPPDVFGVAGTSGSHPGASGGPPGVAGAPPGAAGASPDAATGVAGSPAGIAGSPPGTAGAPSSEPPRGATMFPPAAPPGGFSPDPTRQADGSDGPTQTIRPAAPAAAPPAPPATLPAAPPARTTMPVAPPAAAVPAAPPTAATAPPRVTEHAATPAGVTEHAAAPRTAAPAFATVAEPGDGTSKRVVLGVAALLVVLLGGGAVLLAAGVWTLGGEPPAGGDVQPTADGVQPVGADSAAEPGVVPSPADPYGGTSPPSQPEPGPPAGAPPAPEAAKPDASARPEQPEQKAAEAPPEPPPNAKAPEEKSERPPPPKVQRVAGGVLAGKATRRVQPSYPAMAQAARVEGAVVVEVTIDESGRVISARAISGHPLLRDAAVQAARGWAFSPTLLSGQPVKVIGTITFNFKAS